MDCVYWIRGQEFVELARLSIASVRRVIPQAKIYVYTDDPEHTPAIENTTHCALTPGRPAMVANLDAQLLHLNTADYGREVMFLDADTLVRSPLPFTNDTDLIVTWRDAVAPGEDPKQSLAALMPWNYGVIGVRVNAATREAFTWLRSTILQMGPGEQAWYGNQLALAGLVGSHPVSGSATKTVPIQWSFSDRGFTRLRVMQLPCAEWNWTPQAVDEDIEAKHVIHLKGNRKHLMEHYSARLS